MRLWLAVLGLAAAALLLSQSSSQEELLWQRRNRGKALYENPATQTQAVEEFRRALLLAPQSARERLNYGLALLRAGRVKEAIPELEKVQQQDPKLPHTWFNLGIVWKREGDTARAIRQFEELARLVPDEPVAQYQLGVLYKLENKTDAAIAKFETASRLGPHLAAPHFQLFNAYRMAGRREDSARQLEIFQQLKKQQEGAAIPEDMEWCEWAEIYDPIPPETAPGEQVSPKFSTRRLPGSVDAATAGMLALDADGDGAADLLVWSAKGISLYRSGATVVSDSGLALIEGVRGVAAADFDNDGLPDLCVLTAASADLYRNQKGKFVKAGTLAPGAFTKALWIDYDHDYDSDLILLGAKPLLLRNEGEAGFADHTRDFPFVVGDPVDGVVIRVMADTKGFDVAVTYRDRPAVLYRDRLTGKYESTPFDALPAGARDLLVWDWNNDGYFDLAFRRGDEIQTLVNRRGVWQAEPARRAAGAFVFADFADNAVAGMHVQPAVAMTAADFDRDGKIDLAVVGQDGSVSILRNETPSTHRWLALRLTGVKNLKLAPGTEVEVKAGRRYQKRLWEGVPLLFGLRDYQKIDALRITWPNGLIQNETPAAIGRTLDVKEAPRLSGSCPMIYTWNGKRFEFLTDVLGVAPLGASSGDGSYFPTDHDEYVWISSEALAPAGGTYDVRIAEELGEVTYLDQVKLIAVDHPAGTEVFSNDKWKSPPYPEFRLFTTDRRVYPIAAVDHRGNDVVKRVSARDRVYVDGFERDMRNVAEMHYLELDFGAAPTGGRPFLVLNGRVDWADGSTFLGEAQGGRAGLTPPYLQTIDDSGQWRTVIEDMGMPSGKTKTIAVDLTGKFLSTSRRLRIVTNLCVYWDEVFLGYARSTGLQPVLTTLPLQSAQLSFNSGVASTAMWNPTPGMYTRYGDVAELLTGIDDRFVIMGSGDEARLRFSATGPPLPPGWRRDFLLLVDGWAKDSDANTAFSRNVEPLPFHSMSRYPYPIGEVYPGDAAHRSYLERYNTRPASRIMPRLAP